MRGLAKLLRRHGVRHRRQQRLLDDVDQREANFDAAIAERPHRSDDDGVGLAGAPHGGLDVLRAVGARRDAVAVDEANQARAREIGPDDAADAERVVALVLERNDRERQRCARAADDLDRQLGARRQDRECEEERKEETRENGHQARGGFITCCSKYGPSDDGSIKL